MLKQPEEMTIRQIQQEFKRMQKMLEKYQNQQETIDKMRETVRYLGNENKKLKEQLQDLRHLMYSE